MPSQFGQRKRQRCSYQTERNKMPMDDVSPEEAALFFHTVEVNLNQTTTVTGWLPNTAKVHAVDAKPKPKPKAKAASSPERAKSASTPSTPLRSEGPAPPREPTAATVPKENPGKERGRPTRTRWPRLQRTKRGNSVFVSSEVAVQGEKRASMVTSSVRMVSH